MFKVHINSFHPRVHHRSDITLGAILVKYGSDKFTPFLLISAVTLGPLYKAPREIPRGLSGLGLVIFSWLHTVFLLISTCGVKGVDTFCRSCTNGS